jgi:hypothetical protein
MSSLLKSLLLPALLLVPSSSSAQGAPPISGVTGTLATEGTMKTVYRGLNTIVVTTIDGVEHVYRFTKDLIIHGGKTPTDPLAGLKEGAVVVIHYSTEGAQQTVREIDELGDEGLLETEGTITRIERRGKQITVRIGEGVIETFKLTERAASEAQDIDTQTTPGLTKIVIYYKDENGRKVVHYFKKVSQRPDTSR